MIAIPRYIVKFDGAFAFLNNFYRHPFIHRGCWYETGEHAFQVDKVDDPQWKMRIQRAPTPRDAKRLGRVAPMTPGWIEYKRYDAMREVLADKFSPTGGLATQLVNTGNAILVEGNRHHDNTWGQCFCDACSTLQKHNLLGWMLMSQRSLLFYQGAR